MYIESQLPDGWVPDGEAVWVLVQRCDSGEWEAVVPAFSLASQGDSAEAAAGSAMELVDDYLLLCHREGKTYDECRRALWGPRFDFELVADIVRRAVLPRIARRLGRAPRPPRRQVYREPIRRPVGNLFSSLEEPPLRALG